MKNLINFDEGFHSFYGKMDVELVEGSCIIQGYLMKKSVKLRIFSPTHSLPLQFKSNEKFSLNIIPIDDNELPLISRKYYHINHPKFKEILPGIYFDSTFTPIEYPEDKLKYIFNNTKYVIEDNKKL